MTIVAIILERVVVRGVARRGQRAASEEGQATTVTSHGGAVDLD
jgi:hypothetical protein